jgi:sec-independent protein translocase protein TatA
MFSGILQPTHLIILLAVALIFLGPKRLPSAGRAVGQGLREFKDSINRDPQPLAAESTTTADEEGPKVAHEETPPAA